MAHEYLKWPQYWLGYTALYSADLTGALEIFTAVSDALADQPPTAVLADCLARRSTTLSDLGRLAEAAADARRSLALARNLGYPAGEALALVNLSIAAHFADDLDSALQFGWQAEKITADIPGSIVRQCSDILTEVLTEAGDPAAAEQICAAGLARSRDVGDLKNQAYLLIGMAILDLRAGRIEAAGTHLREALQLNLRDGGRNNLFNGLDCCGHLCAATRRPAAALTVWAAHATLGQQQEFIDVPSYARRRQELLRDAWRALGSARARAAEERGRAMSLDTAAEYALMLTEEPGPPQAPEAPGLSQLSARERELVTLVARGRTDAQIAAELFISVRTVSSHLDQIRDKTGCRRRADLTRLALAEGLV